MNVDFFKHSLNFNLWRTKIFWALAFIMIARHGKYMMCFDALKWSSAGRLVSLRKTQFFRECLLLDHTQSLLESPMSGLSIYDTSVSGSNSLFRTFCSFACIVLKNWLDSCLSHYDCDAGLFCYTSALRTAVRIYIKSETNVIHLHCKFVNKSNQWDFGAFWMRFSYSRCVMNSVCRLRAFLVAVDQGRLDTAVTFVDTVCQMVCFVLSRCQGSGSLFSQIMHVFESQRRTQSTISVRVINVVPRLEHFQETSTSHVFLKLVLTAVIGFYQNYHRFSGILQCLYVIQS